LVIVSFIATFFLGAIIFLLFIVLASFLSLFFFFRNRSIRNSKNKHHNKDKNSSGRIIDGEYSIVDENSED
tara:strand:+ start:3246 stop:3458 length:213 start_codon:yes stop_codon:yes gene_type:complete